MSAALPGSDSRAFDEFSNTNAADYGLTAGASYLADHPEDRRTTSQTRSDDGSLWKSFKERLLSKVSATALLIPVISAGVAAGGIVLGAGEAQAQAVVNLDGGAYGAIPFLGAYPGFAGGYYPGTLNIGPTLPTTVNAGGAGTGIYDFRFLTAQFWTINVYAGSIGDGGASLTPRASVRYTELSNETIEEIGAGAANLTLELMGQDSLQTFAGVGAEFPLSSRDNGPVFELDAGWIHEFNDRSTRFVATLEGAGPDHVPFAIQGARVQRDRISTSAGIRGQMTDTVSWRLRYDGTWGDLSNHALTFGITMSR